MRASYKTVILTIILATLVVLFAVFTLSNNTFKRQLLPDPIAASKAKILAIVSSGAPLTPAKRDSLFLFLSGSRMLQYHFTESEKALIVDVLNNRKPVGKKSSSALEDFSQTQHSRFSFLAPSIVII